MHCKGRLLATIATAKMFWRHLPHLFFLPALRFCLTQKKLTMKPRPLSQKNGNGHHAEVETLTERPSLGSEKLISAALSGTGMETEMEEVEGFIALKPGEGDKETYARVGTEAAAEADTLEDPGMEAPITDQNLALKEAFFASYPELEPSTEVIIGTDDRTRILNTTVYPWRAVCALRITAQNNSQWIGTDRLG